MKKRLAVATLILATSIMTVTAKAESTELVSPVSGTTYMRCTGYTDYGLCADGVHTTRKGICAMQKDLIGKTAVVYMVNSDGSIGERIAILEIFDTGYGAYDLDTGLGTIQAGKTIDIWFEDKEALQMWQQTYGDYVYVEIVEGGMG